MYFRDRNPTNQPTTVLRIRRNGWNTRSTDGMSTGWMSRRDENERKTQ
jgi:hypothetical protein